jgi:hypothetical protein
MVAIVILQPEEAEIAVFGSLPEPSYRPFPGSKRDRELEEDPADTPDLDVTSNPIAPTTQFAPVRPARSLTRVGSAEVWKRLKVESALLLTERPGELRIIAVGTVEGSSRIRDYQGTRNLEVRVRFTLANPIPFVDISTSLGTRDQGKLNEILNGQLRPLSPRLRENLLEAVARHSPGLNEAVKESLDQANAERRVRAQDREHGPTRLSQEAMASTLRFFSPAWHHLAPEPDPSPSESALLLENLSGLTENDHITDDASVFPGWDRSACSRGGWWEFHNQGRRLLVKNINVSPAETHTGADLVYLRRNPDTFVLVQYKVLEPLAERLVFRPDGRLDDQVRRMLRLEQMPRGQVSADAPSDYRLGEGFSFVKFVKPSAEPQDRPGSLAPGYYLPSEFVRRMLLSPDTGPRGGKVHYVEEQRYINPDNFARLVRDNWVGSTGDITDRLRQVFGLRDPTTNLVLATDEPIQLSPKGS